MRPSPVRFLAHALLATTLALVAPRASHAAKTDTAKVPQTPVGFSKLLVRLEGHDDIGFVSDGQSVRFLEQMRAKGFHAVGAENLVFGKDESAKAEFLVGGTVKELECLEETKWLSCRIGVEWQLFDVAHDAVVYSVLSRAAVLGVPMSQKESYPNTLLIAALDQLLEREGFREALANRGHSAAAKDPTFTPATLPRCATPKKVTESAEDLLRVTTIVKVGKGFGSGFLVSPEGLVITAAHAVEKSKLVVRLREGTEVDAVPVRIAPSADVALLRTTKPLNGHACASLRTDLPPVGAEVYAAGAPASLTLAFSLTRGIVSGAPIIDGHRRLQTDTPVNPGNSGGPLADVNGQVVGVVSFKLVGNSIQGVGFAVPTSETLAALGLTIGDKTDPKLSTETAIMPKKEAPERFDDEPDEKPSLDPIGDARRAEMLAREQAEAKRRAELRAREEARDRITPGYVPVLRWGGVALTAVGLVTVLATNSSYDANTTTRAEFESLRWQNTLGWAGIGIGVGAFITSFVLQPALPAAVPTGANTRLRVGLGSLQWEGSF
jgi:S1-C subfamily serine protease